MSYDIKTRIPDPESTRKILSDLSQLDLNEITYNELDKLINQHFKVIPYKLCRFQKGGSLFRARKNEGEEPFKQVNQIYIAPKNRIEEFGRANKPKQQIFYCGVEMKQAAFEVLQDYKNSHSPYDGVDSVTIGEYEIIKEFDLAQVIFSSEAQKIRPEFKEHLEKEKETVDLADISEDFKKSTNMLLEFFSDKFAEPNLKNKEYMFSVFYLNYVLGSNEFLPNNANFKFVGVNYPSVARKYKFDNQAMTLDAANECLKLKNIYNVLCTGFDFEKGDLTIGVLNDAKSWDDGNIEWNTELYRRKK